MKLLKGLSSAQGTKRALIASAACTLLCGLLLFSTSIAWFTANKESNLNELYSGNLDVELSYFRETDIQSNETGYLNMANWDWKKVESGTVDIFKVKDTNGDANGGERNMLWEPGAVNVVYFKIENKGNLAAKYDFTVEIGEEVGGKNFAEQDFMLSNYIYGGVKDVTAAYGTNGEGREAAKNAISENKRTLQQIHTGAPLIIGEMNGTNEHPNTKTFALVLYMPDDAGDATNYKTPTGENAQRPGVKLKVKLIATQDVGENDSFGNQYDNGAYEIKVVVPTLPENATPEQIAEHKTAVNEAVATAVQSAEPGSTIRLPETTGEETIVLPNIPQKITIKGDGTTKVVLDNNAYGASAAALPNGATLENVVLDCGDSLYHGFHHSGPIEFKNCNINGKLTLYGPTVFTNCTINTTTSNGADYIWTYGCDVTFDNCTFDTTGKAILCYNEANGSGYNNVTVKNCTFNATAGAKAVAIANQNCAAIEIDNYGCGVNLTLSNNTVQKSDNAFSGEWRIKSYYPESANDKIIVNGVEYTSIALDGKTMTIDGSKNVTVNN